MRIIPRRLAAILLGFAMMWVGCSVSYLPGLPPGSPFAEAQTPSPSLLSQGIAVGDVSSHSALLWVRTDGPARITVYYGPVAPESEAGLQALHSPGPRSEAAYETTASQDYTLTISLDGLRPSTAYAFRMTAVPVSGEAAARSGTETKADELTGRFTTLPDSSTGGPINFGWSADVGGQAQCRDMAAGYPIFDVLRRFPMEFFLLLGDTVYADERCSAPPNAPGSDFAAVTLENYRAKHRYQRASLALQRFLASVPVFVVWDDHEVRNNFSGPFEERMPEARQALFEYWPIRRDPIDPHRLYRRVSAGAVLDVFILDTRQYRSRNGDPDGPDKTMLGKEQLAWLLDGLQRSTAVWKVIASSVPLSVPKPGPLHTPGNDGWANGTDGTGFETELKRIAECIVSQKVRNVVWLAADVHFVEANIYDVDGDGTPDFHEFVAGPLSAASGRMVPPRSPFQIRTLIQEGGYRNFGTVRADEMNFNVTIVDESGRRRFAHHLEAR
jgi:alkaline phosphatase D